METDELRDLKSFALVAEERSFTRAAARLGISASALSHTMRNLETRLGVQLLARTTRSVSPTAAGLSLLDDLGPALAQITKALAAVRQQREHPSGRIRLVVSRSAMTMVVLPKLAAFYATYPDIVLEITTVSGPVDLVSGRFDAGIQVGEFIQKDMIATRLTKDHRLAVVGSPQYFKSHTQPRTPYDLKEHRCINFPGHRWEFERRKKRLSVGVTGPLLIDDPPSVVLAALEGIGLGLAFEEQVSSHVQDGALVQVLQGWSPLFPGFFLFYPSRKHHPLALTALIQSLRL